MKWIKIFEKFEEDEYYKKIDSESIMSMESDIINFSKKIQMSSFSNKEKCHVSYPKESVSSWLINLGYDITEYIDNNKSRAFLEKNTDEKTCYMIDIWEMKDEYYLVFIDELICDDSVNGGDFYKCDQWEGVEKIIKKYII